MPLIPPQPRPTPPPQQQGPVGKLKTREEHETMLALMADLRDPVGPQGEVLGTADIIAPIVSHQLTLCGWRLDRSKRRQKARKVYGQGVKQGAVTWIDINAPDDPLDRLHEMSVAELEALPDDARIEALRRLGMPVAAPEPNPGWHTETDIRITDEPDPGDDEEQP